MQASGELLIYGVTPLADIVRAVDQVEGWELIRIRPPRAIIPEQARWASGIAAQIGERCSEDWKIFLDCDCNLLIIRCRTVADIVMAKMLLD